MATVHTDWCDKLRCLLVARKPFPCYSELNFTRRVFEALERENERFWREYDYERYWFYRQVDIDLQRQRLEREYWPRKALVRPSMIRKGGPRLWYPNRDVCPGNSAFIDRRSQPPPPLNSPKRTRRHSTNTVQTHRYNRQGRALCGQSMRSMK